MMINNLDKIKNCHLCNNLLSNYHSFLKCDKCIIFTKSIAKKSLCYIPKYGNVADLGIKINNIWHLLFIKNNIDFKISKVIEGEYIKIYESSNNIFLDFSEDNLKKIIDKYIKLRSFL